MATVTFDTLKFVKTLKEAGVPESQAEAFSTAVQESHEAADLATKADLLEYESVIRGDLEKLETGLRHEMGDLRHEIKALELRIHGEMLLLKWMLGLLIAGVASLILKSFFGV
jgi:DNA-binding transcriptional MerR regulator